MYALAADEERALILRCQAGDKSAFEPLVKRYMRQAASFALGWTGSHDTALDVSQDAFVRAYRAIDRFDPERPFYPWFQRILRNVCLNHIRKRKRQAEVDIDDVAPAASSDPLPDTALERKQLQQQVWSAIHDLNEQDREILVLREFQGLSYAEISDVLDIPKGTVMSRLHNARRRLRDRLADVMSSMRGRQP
jgi:RNA polymerase sigma-70 factor (ECF subfamily)